MAQSRMMALFLLCIENDIVEILQFDNVIWLTTMPNRKQEECQTDVFIALIIVNYCAPGDLIS